MTDLLGVSEDGGEIRKPAAIRVDIDVLNGLLSQILARRSRLVREMGLSKAMLGDEIFQPGREAEVLDQVVQAHHNAGGLYSDERMRTIFTEIMDASKDVQNEAIAQVPSTTE